VRWLSALEPRGENGYVVHQSVEIGYRAADVTGSQPRYDTLVNLRTGPRFLDQTLSMQSQNHDGLLFDNLFVNSFGWGGDPSNGLRARLDKALFEGLSFSSVHEGTDALLYQAWNTTLDSYRIGADVKLAPRTVISYDQFLDYYKGDTTWNLAPFAQALMRGAPCTVELGLPFATATKRHARYHSASDQPHRFDRHPDQPCLQWVFQLLLKYRHLRIDL
jgi:hypothetical protein